MKFTINLTPDEVKVAIAEYIMSEMPTRIVCNAIDVKLNINEVTASVPFFSERTTMQFVGASAEVGEED